MPENDWFGALQGSVRQAVRQAFAAAGRLLPAGDKAFGRMTAVSVHEVEDHAGIRAACHIPHDWCRLPLV